MKDPQPQEFEPVQIQPKKSIDSPAEIKNEKSPPSGHLDQWQQGKDDENQFYSIYSNVENLKYTPRDVVPENVEKKKVLIHINSRNILPEVAYDIRMMHRQVVRLLRLNQAGFQILGQDRFIISTPLQTCISKPLRIFHMI